MCPTLHLYAIAAKLDVANVYLYGKSFVDVEQERFKPKRTIARPHQHGYKPHSHVRHVPTALNLQHAWPADWPATAPAIRNSWRRIVRQSGARGMLCMHGLHRESSKRLAPPRNTKDRKHPQSTRTTINRHNSQTKHQALSKGQPASQDA